MVRRLFHSCKLVHADLSEYNILYHQNHLYIIDVSQSVEHDHPAAFDFLRNDIKNVEDFFGRLGVPCLGLKRCFEFITRERLIPDSPSGVLEEEVLTRWLGQGESRYEGEDTVRETTQAHEDSVFMRSFIPRTLNEVYDPERDVEKLTKGQGGDLIYADTIGIVEPLSILVLEGETEGVRLVEKTAKQKTVFGSTTPSPRMWSSIPSLGEDDLDQKDFVILTAETKSTEGEGGGGKEEEDESRSEEEEGVSEEGSDIGDVEHHKDGWVEKIPKGHRHEDREAKKVSYPTALYGRKGKSNALFRLSNFLICIVFS